LNLARHHDIGINQRQNLFAEDASPYLMHGRDVKTLVNDAEHGRDV